MSYIGDQFIAVALYLGVERDGRIVPGGTAFIVSDPIGRGDTSREYLVTARHVLENCLTDNIFVLANARNGGRETLPTHRENWLLSREADVALLPIPGWREDRGWDVLPVPTELFIGEGEEYKPFFTDLEVIGGTRVFVGDEMFFAGLFVQSAGVDRNLPVARFGRIARLPGEPLMFSRYLGQEVFESRGYLVETLSIGGFSGSPAFWRRPASRPVIRNGRHIGVEQTYVVGLLGLVSAHYETSAGGQLRVGDELARVQVLANSGLAVVTPATEILALCQRPDVLEIHDQSAGQEGSSDERNRGGI